MFPVLQLGPLVIQTPGLILLLGFWVGMEFAERHAVQRGISEGQVYNLIWISLIIGLLGARLGFIAQYPAAFVSSPLSILALSPQMLSIPSGLLAAFLTALVITQRKKLSAWPTLDSLVSLLAVMVVALGLAHLASGDAYGLPTTLPWGIQLWGNRRHPTQLYETILALVVLVVLWPTRKNPYSTWIRPEGTRFWAFLALSSISWILAETFRAEGALLFGVRQSQIIAWLILGISIWGWRKRLFPNRTVQENH